MFQAPYFHEALLKLPKPVDTVLASLRAQGIDGGYAIAEHYPTLDNTLLVCATEMRTEEDIALYASALAACLQ